jgi:exodeoxyribonuclease I
MTNTYLFYDIETTGLNPCFDQVLQFAAIRTDLNLNEINRHEIRIKLNSDIIPGAGACLTHRQGIEAMQSGVNEYDGIRDIHQLINTPGTISLGYNTLGFDDEFLRFSFYRNLLSPYTHQFANQCYRMDIYPLTIMYYLFARETIEWPMINDKVSLRLEHLNTANQLASGMAHDAMVDVEATLELAKKLKTETALWDYCCGYLKKPIDLQRLDALEKNTQIGHQTFARGYAIHGKIGIKNQFIAPVIGLGQHRVYKNQTLWLRLDQTDFSSRDSEEFTEQTPVIRKKAAENIFIIPYLERYHQHINKDRQALIESNLTWLQQHGEDLLKLQHYQQNYTYPTVDNVDDDAMLYELPFASKSQQAILARFHQAPPEDKYDIAQSLTCQTTLELAQRILCKHFSKQAPADILQDFNGYLERIFGNSSTALITDYRNRHKLNASTALHDIDSQLNKDTLNDDDLTLLTDLRSHIVKQQECCLNHESQQSA